MDAIQSGKPNNKPTIWGWCIPPIKMSDLGITIWNAIPNTNFHRKSGSSDVDPTKSPMPWRFQVQSLHQTWDAAWGNGQQQQTWGNMGSSFIADLD